jgi:hypothetical protein
MAFGDVGGVVTELVLTCQTVATGTVSIGKGDAVKVANDYVVSPVSDAEGVVFGQALAGAKENATAIPVKVRGVCVFSYVGDTAPTVNGVAGIVASATAGKVKVPSEGNGKGINLKVDSTNKLVHVLL